MIKDWINDFKFKYLFSKEDRYLLQRVKVIQDNVLFMNNEFEKLGLKVNNSIITLSKDQYNNDFPFAFISYSNVNPNDFEKIFNYSSFTKYELLIIGAYSINQDYEGCWRYFEDFYKQQGKVNLQQIILEANVANINGTINILLNNSNIKLSKKQNLFFHLNPKVILLN